MIQTDNLYCSNKTRKTTCVKGCLPYFLFVSVVHLAISGVQSATLDIYSPMSDTKPTTPAVHSTSSNKALQYKSSLTEAFNLPELQQENCYIIYIFHHPLKFFRILSLLLSIRLAHLCKKAIKINNLKLLL